MPINVFDRELKKIWDPLTEETRKIRKSLLTWCLVSVAITAGGLFPTEITVLGLKITTSNKAVLLSLVTAILLYFLVTFSVYGISDAATWFFRQKSTDWEEDVANYEDYKKDLLAKAKLSPEVKEFMEEHERRLGAIWRCGDASKKYERIMKITPFISKTRAALDFCLPVVFSVISLFLLIRDLF